LVYRKYIQAATASKMIAKIQRDESLIPVFLAIGPNLKPKIEQKGKRRLHGRTVPVNTLSARSAIVLMARIAQKTHPNVGGLTVAKASGISQ
jgi:hypothetical protein